MTTNVCIECNSEIPAASELCPQCGHPAEPGQAATVTSPEPAAPEISIAAASPAETAEDAETAPAPAPVQAAQPAAAPAAEAPAAARKKKASPEKTKAGDTGVDQLLRDQMEAFNKLAAAVDGMIEENNDGNIKALVASIANFVNSAENTNNDMLSDLITNIGRFVDSSERIKDEMLNGIKEQNLTAISSMQEMAGSFSAELKAAATEIKEAQKGSVAEMNGIVQQVKAAVSKRSAGGGSDNPYVFYICVIMLFFTVINFFVAAYVLRLVK
jgi:soluble cytochrome b562